MTNGKIINYDINNITNKWIDASGKLASLNGIKSYIFDVKQNTNYNIVILGAFNRFICGLGNSETTGSTYESLIRLTSNSYIPYINYEFNSGANTKFIVTYQYNTETDVEKLYLIENSINSFKVNNVEVITNDSINEILKLDRKSIKPNIINGMIIDGSLPSKQDGTIAIIENNKGLKYKLDINGYFNRFRIMGINYQAYTGTLLYDSSITSYDTREIKYIIQPTNYDYYIIYLQNGTDENFEIDKFNIIEYDNENELTLEDFTIKNYNNVIENYSYISKEMPTFISNYSSLITAYDNLLSNEYITKENLGNDSSGLPIYDYKITTGNYNEIVGQRGSDSEVQKEKILIVTGVHGYERASINSTYYFVKDLLSNYALNSLLENYEIHIVPCVTPWGFNNNSRVNYNSVNINRNFNANWQQTPEGQDYSGASAADQVETQIIQNLISTLKPNYYIDYHNSGYDNEVSYIANPDDYVKSIYRNNISNLVSYWINQENFSNDLIFLYTGSTQINGSSNKYAESININSTLLETSWNINSTGKESSLSIKTGSETLGNIILGIWNKEN